MNIFGIVLTGCGLIWIVDSHLSSVWVFDVSDSQIPTHVPQPRRIFLVCAAY